MFACQLFVTFTEIGGVLYFAVKRICLKVMSESKRNKKYSNKKQETKRPVILTKRETSSKDEKSTRKSQTEEKVQPKILLKVKEKEPTPTPITIATREHQEPSSTSQPPAPSITIQSKDRDAGSTPVSVTIEQPHHPIPQMTRPVPLISSAVYQINQNTQKLFMKSNSDFFVVGVLGTQGVGKSTIMNLLACEEQPTNIYNHFFKDKEGIFPTKCKSGKPSSCPHTESVQMFITKDRMILLDCPPILCNSYRKDATTNELDDIKLLIFLLAACHLVIVVQDDFFNLNLIRLIQFAELAKPSNDNKSFVSDYFPNILFIQNNANRIDFVSEEKLKKEAMLRHFFKRSQLKIFIGQCDKQKKGKQMDGEKCVNYFVFPEVKDETLTAYHPSLDLLVMELRNRVFMSPRNQIYNGNTELTEALWYELITSITTNKTNFFLSTYEEIRRNHSYGSGSEQAAKGSEFVTL